MSGWVDWAIGLYAVALLLPAGAGNDPSGRAGSLAGWQGGACRPIRELHALVDDEVSRLETYGSLLVVLVILVLMVFK